MTPNVQGHSDKVIGGKTPQLSIIAEVFGHTASKRRHCRAFELKNQVIKTFISVLNFSLNVGKLNITVTDCPELPRVSEVTPDDGNSKYA